LIDETAAYHPKQKHIQQRQTDHQEWKSIAATTNKAFSHLAIMESTEGDESPSAKGLSTKE
jgi:hypothetical protein